jgi:hypothetical protein
LTIRSNTLYPSPDRCLSGSVGSENPQPGSIDFRFTTYKQNEAGPGAQAIEKLLKAIIANQNKENLPVHNLKVG